jgi:hypothetical protein
MVCIENTNMNNYFSAYKKPVYLCYKFDHSLINIIYLYLLLNK